MPILDTRTIVETGRQSNPFLGLRPFEYHENHLFFGRDGQSERLIEKLGPAHFLAVVGTSGSGKSSLTRAGLLPGLMGGFMAGASPHWRIAIMRPGSDPIGNLARALNDPDVFGSDIEENAALQIAITEAALRRSSLGLVEATRQAVLPGHENLLVVVDQFEEIFRFANVAEDEGYQNEAAAFVKLILEAAGHREVPIYVVLTMRSDYLGDCAQFWGLPEAVNEAQYLIPRMKRQQLREAITGPAAVAGGEFTERLVNRLLNDIGDNQDQLPVLQHLLMRVWDERREMRLEVEVEEGGATVRRPHVEVHEGEAIDLCCYQAVGGMAEALSLHADESFNELPDERSRGIAEKLFKGLTEKGADNREVRRPVELRDLCALAGGTEAEVVDVIEVFRREGRSFLMPPAGVPLNGHSLIDISHESLIRNWARLREWVDEEARSARLYKRLVETEALYAAGEAGLMRTPELEFALKWRDESRPNEAWARRYHPGFGAAMNFLSKSLDEQQAEAEKKDAARKQEITRARKTILIFGILSLLAVGALMFGLVKSAEARSASAEVQKQREEVDRQTKIAKKSKEEARIKTEEADIAERRARALIQESEKAKELIAKSEKEKALAERKTLAARQNEEKARGAEKEARALMEKAAAARDEAAKDAAEADKRVNQLRYAASIPAAFDAYERGESERSRFFLDDFKTGIGPGSDPRGFEWRYLSSLQNRKLASFDPQYGDLKVTSVAFSPDGKMLATGSAGMFKVWDAATQQLVATLGVKEGGEWIGTAAAFSLSGKLLATADASGFKLWDITSRSSFKLRGGPKSDSITEPALAFSPDGRLLAIGYERGYQIWDTASRRLIMEIPSVASRPALAFSRDGSMFAAGVGNATAKVFDLRTPKRFETREAAMQDGDPQRDIWNIGFLPNFDLLLSDGTEIQTVDLDDFDEPHETFKIPLGVAAGDFEATPVMAFSPDGRTFVTGLNNEVTAGGGVKLWDARSFALLATFEGLGLKGNVTALALSRDGRTLAIAGDEGIQLSNAEANPNFARVNAEGWVNSIVALTGGKQFTTFSQHEGDNVSLDVKQWDAVTRKALNSFKAEGRLLAVSPDGQTLATVDEESTHVSVRDTVTNNVRSNLIMGDEERLKGGLTAAFSPDGKLIAINAGSDGNYDIQLWDTQTGEAVGSPFGSTYRSRDLDVSVNSIAFSPNGKLIAAANSGRIGSEISIFNAETGQTLVTITAPTGEFPTSLRFSPDSRLLALAKNTNILELWDVSSLSTYGQGKDVEQWNRNSPQLLATLDAKAESMAFSPDGKTLVTASDNNIQLWNVATYQPLIELAVQAGSKINSVDFSSDGQILLAGDDKGYVNMWYATRPPRVEARVEAPASTREAYAESGPAVTLWPAPLSILFQEAWPGPVPGQSLLRLRHAS